MTREQRLDDFIITNEIATEQEVMLATQLCGYTFETMWRIIRIRTALNSMHQLEQDGFINCDEDLDD